MFLCRRDLWIRWWMKGVSLCPSTPLFRSYFPHKLSLPWIKVRVTFSWSSLSLEIPFVIQNSRVRKLGRSSYICTCAFFRQRSFAPWLVRTPVHVSSDDQHVRHALVLSGHNAGAVFGGFTANFDGVQYNTRSLASEGNLVTRLTKRPQQPWRLLDASSFNEEGQFVGRVNEKKVPTFLVHLSNDACSTAGHCCRFIRANQNWQYSR